VAPQRLAVLSGRGLSPCRLTPDSPPAGLGLGGPGKACLRGVPVRGADAGEVGTAFFGDGHVVMCDATYARGMAEMGWDDDGDD
jgi:hypothetical protein